VVYYRQDVNRKIQKKAQGTAKASGKSAEGTARSAADTEGNGE